MTTEVATQLQQADPYDPTLTYEQRAKLRQLKRKAKRGDDLVSDRGERTERLVCYSKEIGQFITGVRECLVNRGGSSRFRWLGWSSGSSHVCTYTFNHRYVVKGIIIVIIISVFLVIFRDCILNVLFPL